MKDTDLFQMALSLTPPWQVQACEFDPDKKQLDIKLDFPKGSTFDCPEWGDFNKPDSNIKNCPKNGETSL